MPILRLGELRNSRTVFSSSRPLVIVPITACRGVRRSRSATSGARSPVRINPIVALSAIVALGMRRGVGGLMCLLATRHYRHLRQLQLQCSARR
jgi:hypothetical protein